MIDPKALYDLQSLIGGRRADLVDLVRDFLADAPDQIAAMGAAAQIADTDTLRRGAHALKSNGRDLGATMFAQLCANLEADLGSAHPGIDMVGRVQEIARALPILAATLEAEIAKDEQPS